MKTVTFSHTFSFFFLFSFTLIGKETFAKSEPEFFLSRASIYLQLIVIVRSARRACWLEHRTCDKRLHVWIPAGAAQESYSPESTLCADSLFGVLSTPVLPQWHVKVPSHSAKSADGRLHLNRHTPMTQFPSIVWEPMRKWAYTQLIREHSATAVCLLSHCGLILA